MSLNIELLEQSFSEVSSQGNELVERFYRHLFADFPQVRPLFQNVEIGQQQKKLLASIKLVVENLRRPKILVPALEELGARHVTYGAEEAHYPAVGQTLLKSLSEVAGDDWTDELQKAWAEALDTISQIMLAGASVAVV